VEPRDEYEKLAHSRVLAPVDNKPVWSVTCFYVTNPYRRQGITVSLLNAAVEHVRQQGGKSVEGYPVDARKNMPAPFVFTGMAWSAPCSSLETDRTRPSKIPGASFNS
jgi:GNAT superfamily N-acetyltransferase